MSIIATDTQRLSNLVKHEYEPSLGFCREALTFKAAADAKYAMGTVLGKVTATGEYVEAQETAADGSKVPVAVVIEDFTVSADSVIGIAITAAGATYTDGTYDLVITGTGKDAKATATIASGKVTAVNIVNAGTGYTSAPTVALPTGAGAGDGNAALTATVGDIRKVNTIVRGAAILSTDGIKLHSSYNTAAKKAAAYAALEAKNILVNKSV